MSDPDLAKASVTIGAPQAAISALANGSSLPGLPTSVSSGQHDNSLIFNVSVANVEDPDFDVEDFERRLAWLLESKGNVRRVTQKAREQARYEESDEYPY